MSNRLRFELFHVCPFLTNANHLACAVLSAWYMNCCPEHLRAKNMFRPLFSKWPTTGVMQRVAGIAVGAQIRSLSTEEEQDPHSSSDDDERCSTSVGDRTSDLASSMRAPPETLPPMKVPSSHRRSHLDDEEPLPAIGGNEGVGRVEQLGWPRVRVHYRSGTRIPTGATVDATDAGGRPLRFEVESKLPVPIHVGGGYGGDPDWLHGMWKGPAFTERLTYDMTDPAVIGRSGFGVIDHVGRAVCHEGGQESEGWGLFEHGALGRHDPSGFADWLATAP